MASTNRGPPPPTPRRRLAWPGPSVEGKKAGIARATATAPRLHHRQTVEEQRAKARPAERKDLSLDRGVLPPKRPLRPTIHVTPCASDDRASTTFARGKGGRQGGREDSNTKNGTNHEPRLWGRLCTLKLHSIQHTCLPVITHTNRNAPLPCFLLSVTTKKMWRSSSR